MFIDYIPLIFTVLFGIAFAWLFRALAAWLGEKRYSEDKYSTYESGMIPFGDARRRFSVKYYMVAVSFIIFDIEVVFLYPWAVRFKEMGAPGIIAMSVFVFILLLAYIYELRKGGFEWD